ncbi:MAG: DNA-packaging protein [Christensenellaceae bacterium]|jgi:hypothetical protein|nr:DNA-packaging protein [Christensenellaceae bacterium]
MATPRKHKDPKVVKKLIDDYFSYCEGTLLLSKGEPVLYKCLPVYRRAPVPPTVAGLVYALGFADEQSVREYEIRGAGADATPEEQAIGVLITRAKWAIRQYVEQRLFDKDGARGAVWWLAVHAGQREKAEADAPQTIVIKMASEDDGLAD